MNSKSAAAQVTQDTAGCSPLELCRRAIEALDHVLEQKPVMRLEEIDKAERLAVRLRDCLIDRLRQANEDGKAHIRPALTQVNMSISLLAGVEYPAAGIQEKPLQQARALLQELIDREWL